jgi:hypothetical protein
VQKLGGEIAKDGEWRADVMEGRRLGAYAIFGLLSFGFHFAEVIAATEFTPAWWKALNCPFLSSSKE